MGRPYKGSKPLATPPSLQEAMIDIDLDSTFIYNDETCKVEICKGCEACIANFWYAVCIPDEDNPDGIGYFPSVVEDFQYGSFTDQDEYDAYRRNIMKNAFFVLGKFSPGPYQNNSDFDATVPDDAVVPGASGYPATPGGPGGTPAPDAYFCGGEWIDLENLIWQNRGSIVFREVTETIYENSTKDNCDRIAKQFNNKANINFTGS